MVGGLLAGIGASACCVGPLLLLSLGISGAWIGHLTALEPYRPVFIALTVMFLGLAFWKLYLAPQTCGGTADCISRSTRHIQRVFFWISVLIALAFMASPWILPMFYR
jgi:mercuric ion transport protein